MTDANAACDHDWEAIVIDPDFLIDVCMNCGLERSQNIQNDTITFTPGTPDGARCFTLPQAVAARSALTSTPPAEASDYGATMAVADDR